MREEADIPLKSLYVSDGMGGGTVVGQIEDMKTNNTTWLPVCNEILELGYIPYALLKTVKLLLL